MKDPGGWEGPDHGRAWASLLRTLSVGSLPSSLLSTFHRNNTPETSPRADGDAVGDAEPDTLAAADTLCVDEPHALGDADAEPSDDSELPANDAHALLLIDTATVADGGALADRDGDGDVDGELADAAAASSKMQRPSESGAMDASGATAD